MNNTYYVKADEEFPSDEEILNVNSYNPTVVLTSTNICECDSCKGKGWTKKTEVTNYHDYTENTYRVKCKDCDGSGFQKIVIKSTGYYSGRKFYKKSVPASRDEVEFREK